MIAPNYDTLPASFDIGRFRSDFRTHISESQLTAFRQADGPDQEPLGYDREAESELGFPPYVERVRPARGDEGAFRRYVVIGAVLWCVVMFGALVLMAAERGQ